MKRVIMGLDVSTKCVGITVASVNDDYTLNILDVTHLRPKVPRNMKGTEALFLKSDTISNGIKKYAEYGVSEVVIEEPLIGSNNSMTAAVLLRYNGMISQAVYNTLHVVPSFISSYDARKYGCPQLIAVRKYSKDGSRKPKEKVLSALKKGELVLFGDYTFDCSKKLILWNIVSEKYPGINWQYNTKGELKPENFDASDSLICVMGYVNKQKFGDCTPEISSYDISENDGHVSVNYDVKFCNSIYKQKITL